jgi:hypothetical protein
MAEQCDDMAVNYYGILTLENVIILVNYCSIFITMASGVNFNIFGIKDEQLLHR